MKNKETVKKATEKSLWELLKLINNSLEPEDANSLFIELAASIFTYSLDFNMSKEDIIKKTIIELETFKIMVLDGVVNAKDNLKEGQHYYDNNKN